MSQFSGKEWIESENEKKNDTDLNYKMHYATVYKFNQLLYIKCILFNIMNNRLVINKNKIVKMDSMFG